MESKTLPISFTDRALVGEYERDKISEQELTDELVHHATQAERERKNVEREELSNNGGDE